ncbi:hypothetical protein WJX81_000988 [Elliptochloris bilobata]|uniref:Uncharacterized protein n=1 Tax=Elliptochloris bilobata TaxID=381761 RepID=A0AAW1RMD1_9CHLO
MQALSALAQPWRSADTFASALCNYKPGERSTPLEPSSSAGTPPALTTEQAIVQWLAAGSAAARGARLQTSISDPLPLGRCPVQPLQAAPSRAKRPRLTWTPELHARFEKACRTVLLERLQQQVELREQTQRAMMANSRHIERLLAGDVPASPSRTRQRKASASPASNPDEAAHRAAGQREAGSAGSARASGGAAAGVLGVTAPLRRVSGGCSSTLFDQQLPDALVGDLSHSGALGPAAFASAQQHQLLQAAKRRREKA